MTKVGLQFLLASSGAAEVIFQPQQAANSVNISRSIPLDLTDLLDNRGFGKDVGDADFDGEHSCYPADSMPPSSFVYNGFNFAFPTYNATGNDNLISDGQTIDIPLGRYLRVSMLAASEQGLASGTVNASYSTGANTTGGILVPSWWSWPYPFGGDLVFPHYFTNESVDWNRSNIFQTDTWLDGSRNLTSITLPIATGADSGPGGSGIDTRLHIFSISLLPVSDLPGLQLEVQQARTTQKWIEGTNKTQIVEVIVNNVGDEWVTRENAVNITVESEGLQTVEPAQILRLRPGDQAIVEVGVVNSDDVAEGSTGSANAVLSTGIVHTFNATFGIAQYEDSYESIYGHESPPWYNDAKFGIFIHWGVYSVPAWGSTGDDEVYAEWYWHDLNQGPDNKGHTYEHHLETYGPDVVYDDFIANFTASAWQPKQWVDLFSDSGAQYFVQVSKHHDGYAIFDIPPNITTRTSIALLPHRDFIADLFAAAREHQPHLHPSVYFSLPEWFHPNYREIGFAAWPGGNATNPFTNETLPYTGYVEVEDFVRDLINPQMEILAHDPRYEVDIMWCDIGGPNMTTTFASKWFNYAAAQGRQVLQNARCGLPGDFDTPEYARYPVAQRRKWESNLGLDPYSYGYNVATPRSDYMNASSIVKTLVDVVSKNGNFLLDIGPTENGTIVDVEVQALTEAGKWIKNHAEAVFNTTYWFVAPEAGEGVRFTKTGEGFYVHLLSDQGWKGGVVEVRAPVPWREGDVVRVAGGGMDGEVVGAEALEVDDEGGGVGGVRLNVTEEMWRADEFVWVFKIEY